MYRVAVIEDESESYESIKKCFDMYSEEYNEVFSLVWFKTGLDFLDEYNFEFDFILMDIDMPHLNGLQTAAYLRKKDSKITIIFVTQFAKYAINGYEVDAMDYVLKPLNYNTFKLKIQRAVKSCRNERRQTVILSTSEGVVKIELNMLDYIEIISHKITIHTQDGNYKSYGTLGAIKEVLPPDQFSKCNRCYLVNLRNVIKVVGNSLYVGKDVLCISRTRRQKFMDDLSRFVLNSEWSGSVRK